MIEPEAKPDADYTTQQAADLCGISINTLLAWERRYGVPAPRRDERNERLYDANDLRIIRWLQTQTAQGTPIGKAVLLLSELDEDEPPVEPSSEDVVVALDVFRPARADTMPSPVSGKHTTASQAEFWRRDLIAALDRFDRATVASILSAAALQSSPILATEHVILPTLQELRQRYEAGDLDRAVLTTADRWFAARLAHWLDNAVPDRSHAQTITILVPDETPWNAVPALAVAFRLAHEGHHVIDLPPGSPVEEIRSVVTTTDASQVIFMTGSEGDRRALVARIDLLRAVLPQSVTIAKANEDHDSHLQHSAAPSDSDEDVPMLADRIVTGSFNNSPESTS